MPINILKLGVDSFKKSIAPGGGRGIAAGGYINKVKKIQIISYIIKFILIIKK